VAASEPLLDASWRPAWSSATPADRGAARSVSKHPISSDVSWLTSMQWCTVLHVMYVCMYVCMYVHMSLYYMLCICAWKRRCMCIYAYAYVRTFVCMHAHTRFTHPCVCGEGG